jgi:hypothetical protein
MFINGEKVDGAVPPEMVREVINRALREVGEPVPASVAAKPAAPAH